ncbi:hypothetical protein [Streptomyces sp. NPDC014685]|uniref:hypothetical protein n=1 Tax=Streptomyces sp. NPDC014685 TaxID=3364881 RepID=UPI0036F639E4
MSRTQWCCLMAVVAVVLGLFCGPAATVTKGGGASVTAAGVVATVAPAGHDLNPGPAVTSADERQQMPGCGRGKKHDGNEPSLPGRARASYDQAPGLAEWGLPAAIGPGPVRPPARIGLCDPEPAAPTPVELSVLRV